MEDQEVKRRCFDSESGQDFISNLPQSLKDNILMRLNIIVAVRTCILSQSWRYTWCTMPMLVIRTSHFNVVDKDGKLDSNKFIDSLLLHHKGPITKFTLAVGNFHYDDLERWIHLLGNKGVTNLYFKFDTMDSCEIPSSFFSCLLALTDLKFRSRTFDVPQLFGGFKLLHNLELEIATMACTDLERVVTRCPLLQYLRLENMFESFNNLVIESQSLEEIDLIANYEQLVLDTPNLCRLHVKPIDSVFNKEKFKKYLVLYQTYPCRILDLMESHRRLKVRLLKTVPMKLSIKLNHLTQMVVMINLSKEDSLVSALSFFKSAPKLQILDVKLYGRGDLGAYYNCMSFREPEANNLLFSDLKTVIIENCSLGITADSTIAITKFILSTACVLECMIIKDARISVMRNAMESPPMLANVSRNGQHWMRKAMAIVLEVLKLPRLSHKAYVVFENPEIMSDAI